MKFKNFIYQLFFRLFLIVALLIAIVFFIYQKKSIVIFILSLITIFVIYKTYQFIFRRFIATHDFFEAVKYRDFSRWFPEDKGPKDIRALYSGFNEVNRTIKEINTKNEAQFVYLQKILEMVNVGIIAYNLETGDVLWSNDTFKETLDVPSFKNINFIESRKPQIFEAVFETYHKEKKSISITVQNEKIKVLISETIFQVQEDTFKLIVIQNIDDTLNRNESEAWKKLLSVMTHEIMNSITPISSLSDTLQKNIQLVIDNPTKEALDLEDINSGIKTIGKRSEGLLKFAKTYRSLNKITQLNLEKKNVFELFENLRLLMQPSLESKKININFQVKTAKLELSIDTHLIEQVLINLILNAVDACKNKKQPQINVSAEQLSNKNIVIKVYDNGIGIPDDILDNIFVPFFTSKSTGSGIGLSLCKQIMLLHKGKITVLSKKEEGTVFTLLFKN